MTNANTNVKENVDLEEIVRRSKSYYTPEGWKELQELYAVSRKIVNTLSEPEKALLWKGLNENMQETFRIFSYLLGADKDN